MDNNMLSIEEIKDKAEVYCVLIINSNENIDDVQKVMSNTAFKTVKTIEEACSFVEIYTNFGRRGIIFKITPIMVSEFDLKWHGVKDNQNTTGENNTLSTERAIDPQL